MSQFQSVLDNFLSRTPQEVFQRLIAIGIHNPDGTLTDHYRQPNRAAKMTREQLETSPLVQHWIDKFSEVIKREYVLNWMMIPLDSLDGKTVIDYIFNDKTDELDRMLYFLSNSDPS